MLGGDPRVLVARMLAGDHEAAAVLIAQLTPVVRRRVARVLRRRAIGRGLQELDDLVQDAWAALLERNGHALLAWDPLRGLDFPGFVGLLVERAITMRLRTRRRNPWTEDATTDDELVDLVASPHGGGPSGVPTAPSATDEANAQKIETRKKRRMMGCMRRAATI